MNGKEKFLNIIPHARTATCSVSELKKPVDFFSAFCRGALVSRLISCAVLPRFNVFVFNAPMCACPDLIP